MQFSFGAPVNVIEVIISFLSWGLIVYFIYRYYQNQEVKPKVWKACVATLVGLFAFTFNFTAFNADLKIPILPLGVWILLWYASSKKGAWDKYRRYAWLGFYANFIFIGATLLTIFVHNVVYPKDALSTYIAEYEEGAIFNLHPSAEEVTFDKVSFQQQFSNFQEERVNSVEWYNDMFEIEPQDRVEQFPYKLGGTVSKWGSGMPTLIYVEKDGKGILIDSSERQRYFRSDVSILKGGND